MEHHFTTTILAVLKQVAGEHAEELYQRSELLRYLNEKTRSVSRGSKSRSSFGSIYAIYVLVEDYVKQGFPTSGLYSEYEGAQFSNLLRRQRELPFGSKLQNHALNHRANQEFAKFFPTCEYQPILRDVETKRYWINELLLNVTVGGVNFSLAPTVLKIIEAYIGAKTDAFEDFLRDCARMVSLQKNAPDEVRDFIRNRLDPNVDARVFEIVSYSILREYYGAHSVFWGWAMDDIHEEGLVLYKTGRTNANDGGIDFVMKPLGRFFQVTESVDVKKYFLDIDKVQRFPLTFIIKSNDSPEMLRKRIEEGAKRLYPVSRIVSRYMECIEEIINIDVLLDRFEQIFAEGRLAPVIDEIVSQSKVEFNYDDDQA